MNTLYIIGNGFDTAHNLKTSYWYFREYLSNYAESFLVELEKNYGHYPFDEYDYHNGPDPKKIRKIRDESVYNVFWKTIEEALAQVDETSMLSASQSTVENLDLESGLIGIKDTLDYHWRNEYSFVKELQDWVFKWAKQIRLFKCKSQCDELINNKIDLFLSFNYTNTLEKIYKVNPRNVLHIHGGLPPYCYEKPVLGHGDYESIKKYRQKAEEAENEFDEASDSIYNAIADFYENTLKDTKTILFRKARFFKGLSDIKVVKVIGHSLGSVDHVYFKEIIANTNYDVEWFVYYHTDEEKLKFEKIMLEIGVKKEILHIFHSGEFWNS